jgi:hypothetical protein
MGHNIMSELVQLRIDGKLISVPAGTVVAAAIALAGKKAFRESVLNEPRGPLCGMGICMECRVTINSRPHCRSCQILCEPGMEVMTQ